MRARKHLTARACLAAWLAGSCFADAAATTVTPAARAAGFRLLTDEEAKAPAPTVAPPQAAPVKTAPAAEPAPPAAKFEIANGAGRAQIGARFKRFFAGKGVAADSLTNADHFQHERTAVSYRPESAAEAKRIADLLPIPSVKLEQAKDLPASVRLVLGRDALDFDMTLAAATQAPPAPQPAAAEPAEIATPAPTQAAMVQAAGPLPGKRILVSPGAGEFPPSLVDHLTVPMGKSHLIELPAAAQEVLVGDPAIADVSISSPRRMSVIGRKPGETNVYVVGAGGREVAHLEVSVGPDAQVVQAAIARALPGLPVNVSTEGGALILTGTLQSDGEAGRAVTIARQFVAQNEKVVNLIKLSRAQQVLIQVRVAEVQRRALKELGTSMSLNRSDPNSGDRVRGNLNTLGLNPLNQFAATFTLEGIRDLFTTLSVLEQRGFVRNLAEPNLVAVSGETASMLAGGEIPIPVPDRDGIKIEFKPFGVSLSFLPVILDTGNISLKLSTEVSSLSSERIDVPLLTGRAAINSFIVRRAASTVEMPSGGSVMLAGLIQNDVLSGINGVPALMDLPILGQLFRSESFKRNETELVVIVTTSLVQAQAPQAMVAATDSVSPATDMETWAYGKLINQFTPGFVQDASPGAHAPKTFGFTIDEAQP
ncbi:MAG: pilus assembly protein N-terminal domain-containing protein [Rhodospirillaceae bacterium]